MLGAVDGIPAGTAAACWGGLAPWDDLVVAAVTSLAAFGAALMGARVAFGYQLRRDKLAIREKRIAAGQRALFALQAQRSVLHDIGKTLPQNWFDRATHGVTDALSVDVESLTFLLDGRHADLLYFLVVGESQFRLAIFIHEERRHTNAEFQVQLERALGARTAEPTTEELEQIAGRRLRAMLVDMTSHLRGSFRDAAQSNEKHRKLLRWALEDTFPEACFWDYDLSPDYPPEDFKSWDARARPGCADR